MIRFGFAGCVMMMAVALRADTLENRFRELPRAARRNTGPLFWLHGDETPERLNAVLDKVAEGGNGSFTAESRPHKEWLGEGWDRDLGICLGAGIRDDLKMWIFDEDWWPSQTVAGKVLQQYAAKRLKGQAFLLKPGDRYDGNPAKDAAFVALVAGRLDKEGRAVIADSLVDLTPLARKGPVSWRTPADGAAWQVMVFSWVTAPRLKQGNRLSVDGMSRDCVAWFIRTVYDPHHARFGKDFGTTIAGYFYDEPETAGDWGTELDATFRARGVGWMPCYVAWLFTLAGEAQAAAKYQYAVARAETWGRTMFGGITEWCRWRGVLSIGHFMEHNQLYVHNDYCAGDMMLLQKYSSMGGIDAVFDQFVMGQRDTRRDAPCWQTPKLASSISHVYGKADDLAMCEIFGARGQDLTYPEMKWWADRMQVCGVNVMIPHSFNPQAPHDTDCPPYFYNGGFEPRFALYRVWADYSSRLSLMLTGGRHVCPVAVLFSGNARQVGACTTPEDLTSALQDALYDCDWLPFERFEDSVTKIKGNELRLHGERYRALVVPPTEGITFATLEKTLAFFEAGGTVIGYGCLPERSLTLGKTAADIARLREAIWGADARPGKSACRTSAKGGRSYFLAEQPNPSELAATLGEAGVPPVLRVLSGETGGWVHALRRVDRERRDVLFIANQNTNDAARAFTFHAPDASGAPEVWDAMRGEVTAVPWRKEGDGVSFDLTLEGYESALVRFVKRDAGRPARLTSVSRPVATLPVLPDASADPVVYPVAPDNALTVSPVTGSVFQGVVTVSPELLADGRNAYLVCDMEGRHGSKDTLRILKATYAAIDGAGSADVTRLVSERVRGGARVVPVLPSILGGDPAYGHVKTLTVEYEDDGKRATVSARDGSKVTMRAAKENAAAVQVNGEYAGGFIGKPSRVNLTRHLQPGRNTVRVEPFAVEKIRIEIF